MRRTPLILLSLLLAAVLLSACGDDDDPANHGGGMGNGGMGNGGMGNGGMGNGAADGDNSPVADGARRVEVTGTSFEFDPAEVTVEAGEDIAIALTADDVLHDFVIDDLDVHVAADRGETAEGGFRADEPGRYSYYCSVPGHRDAGMEGTLIVR